MTGLEIITAILLLVSAILGLASSWLSFRKEQIALKSKSGQTELDRNLQN